METVLITGANRGIGFEFVRQYLAAGARVIACCREPNRADELQAMACSALRILALDVSKMAEITALPDQLAGESLSLFINNAGAYGSAQTLAEVSSEAWQAVFQVNVIAPLLITRSIQPLMRRGAKLAYLSSKMGSIADNTSGSTYIYRSSKTALNQVIKSLSIDLADSGLHVAALHPGWVRTAMGGPHALIDTETSVQGLRQVIAGLDAGNSGRFFNYDGQEIPW